MLCWYNYSITQCNNLKGGFFLHAPEEEELVLREAKKAKIFNALCYQFSSGAAAAVFGFYSGRAGD